MGYIEELTKLVKKYTENEVDITENWNEWEDFLSDQGYIKTYKEVYAMDLAYLQNNKDMDYWAYGKWDVDALIENDEDITPMSNGCFFVHNQESIPQSVIDEFYKQLKDRKKQQALNYAIFQAYEDLHYSENGFSRFDALLFIVGHDFGYESEKLYFASDIKKVKRELLECFKEVLKLMNDSIDDGYIELWLPNHNEYSNEEDEKYCKLIRFGGYSILEDGQKILNSDAILLKNEESIHTLEYFTYQNMHQLSNYIGELFEFYKKDCFDVGDKEYEQEINEELNRIIDYYWKNGKIDFRSADFFRNEWRW